MSASALFMGATGAAASFLPQEILQTLGSAPLRNLVLLVQVGGALYLALATVNWTARGSLIGGIYNRAVALGNFAHFAIGAIVLAKAFLAGPNAAWLWMATGLYALFAVAFAVILFGSPVKAPSRSES
jgi:hypothetical protein